MRLSKSDYKLLGYFILLLFLCWVGRFLLFIRPIASFPLTQKWQIDLGRSTYERPMYQNGIILFPANITLSSHWYGVEAATGQIVWSQSIGKNNFRRCLNSEHLIVSGPKSLFALRPSTGEIVWSKGRANRVACSEREVFFISSVPRNSIEALDLATGQRLWVGTTPRKSFDGLVYNPEAEEFIAGESTFPGDFYLVEPKTGLLRASFEKGVSLPIREKNTPVEGLRGPMYLVDRGQLFIGGTVLDAQTGQVIHKEDFYGTSVSPTVTEDTMYLSSGYAVVAFDRATYDIKWIYPSQSSWEFVYTISPVTILDGIGYVIYSDSTLRAIDLETGQEIGYWQPGLLDRLTWPVCVPLPFPLCTKLTGVGMSASEDTLFVSFGNGKLYAFGR